MQAELAASQAANERIVFFDEFAVYDRPSLFYSWAERNTRPQVKSDERKKRNKLNGMLCVDAVSGEEFLGKRSLAPFGDAGSCRFLG